jgi:hypothetical protein
MQSVLAGSAARIEHCSGEYAVRRQIHDRRLRPVDVPWRGTVAVRRIPWQTRHSFVTGWPAVTERTRHHRGATVVGSDEISGACSFGRRVARRQPAKMSRSAATFHAVNGSFNTITPAAKATAGLM